MFLMSKLFYTKFNLGNLNFSYHNVYHGMHAHLVANRSKSDISLFT